jgi:alkylhydroperoxidase family enzyme
MDQKGTEVVKQRVERKIGFVEDADAKGEVAKVYDEWRAKSGRQQMPGILKCFSHRPDFLRQVMAFSDTVHFSEGHLNRKTKEAIASYVSYLNRCPY